MIYVNRKFKILNSCNLIILLKGEKVMITTTLEELEIKSLSELPDKLIETIERLECSDATKEILLRIFELSDEYQEVAAAVPNYVATDIFSCYWSIRKILNLMAPNLGICTWKINESLSYIGLVLVPDHLHNNVIDAMKRVWATNLLDAKQIFEATLVVSNLVS